MATDKTTLKEWFKNGKKPDESQFATWIDSYWHKADEKIDLNAINGLENALNNKTEKADFNTLSNAVNTHIVDENLHFTEEEKNKLTNLPKNLDEYAKKNEIEITIQITLEKDENNEFYIDEYYQKKLEEFLSSNTSTTKLQIRTLSENSKEYWNFISISEIIDEEKEYINYKLLFSKIESNDEKSATSDILTIDVKTLYEDNSIKDIQIVRNTVNLAQDFDSNRYDTSKADLEQGDPNMDYYTESGGIAYSDPDKNIVQNLPEEAIKGFGFVVGNDNNQALQIIRDQITGKIYHRGRLSETEWSEWAEMGGGNFVVNGINDNGVTILSPNSDITISADNEEGGISTNNIYLNSGMNGNVYVNDSPVLVNGFNFNDINITLGSGYAFNITHSSRITLNSEDETIINTGGTLDFYVNGVGVNSHANFHIEGGSGISSFVTNIIFSKDINLNPGGKAYYNDNEIATHRDLNDCIKKSRIQVVEEIPELSTLEDGDIIIQL